MIWANIIRFVWGLGFLVAAGFNLIFSIKNQKIIFEFFLENVKFPVYRKILVDIIIPNGTVIIILTAILEIITGLLILNKLHLAKIGLMFAVVWPIFLIPLEWSEMKRNIFLAAVPALLLTQNYETTFLETLSEWFK